jgi:serine/threonine protein kinase
MSENNASASQTAADSRVIAELLDQVTELLAQRRDTDIESLLGRHPEHAERLRQLIPAMRLLANVGCAENAPPAGDSADSPADEVAGALGDFRILREIGRGGMGVVYEAEQLSLDRHVALKVLPFASVLDARQLQRFKNEARAAAGLHHTNIVPVYAVGSDRGVHYYAMQYIEGQTLEKIIARLAGDGDALPMLKRDQRGARAGGDVLSLRDGEQGLENDPEAATAIFPPPGQAGLGAVGHDTPDRGADGENEGGPQPNGAQGVVIELAKPRRHGDTSPLARGSTANGRVTPEYFRTVAELGIQAARALDYAHQQGVVHRDVKPSNLIVDHSGNLWITDFGLARMESEQSLTMSGDVLGTLRYMSPEQALAQRPLVDHRTDVYSLGATLYELLTLKAAFPETDRRELLRQIADEDPRKPQSLNRSIPAELETIVIKAMQKEPDGRYLTAQDLADDLQRFLDHKPIAARPPSFAERSVKWARRHVVAVTAALVVFIICSLVLGASTIWVSHAKNLAHDNETAARKAELEKTTEAEKAKANLQNAVGTVTRLLTNVSEEALFTTPGATSIRSKLLEDAASQLETLCQGQDDPKLLFQASSAFCELGLIRLHIGETESALSTLERALELLAASRSSRNDVSAGRQATEAWIYVWRAMLLQQGDDADSAIDKALVLARAARDREPTYENSRLLMVVLGRRAWNRMMQKRFEEALADVQEAARPVREYLDGRGAGIHDWALRFNECEEAYAAALVHKFRGDSAQAMDLFKKTIGIADEIDTSLAVRGNGEPGLPLRLDRGAALPMRHQIRLWSALACSQLARIYERVGESADARRSFRKAVDLFEPLARDFPDFYSTRLEFVTANAGLASTMEGEEAAAAWRQAIHLCRDLPAGIAPDAQNAVAWRLVSNSGVAPDLAESAVDLAERAVAAKPTPANVNTLGVALFRVKRFRQAVAALLRSNQLDSARGPSFAYNGFFLTMAYREMGEDDESRRWFKSAADWTEANAIGNQELSRFRAEAEELLGLSRPEAPPLPETVRDDGAVTQPQQSD